MLARQVVLGIGGAVGHPHLTGVGVLEPGESKRGEAGTVRAGDDEFIIFNSSAYGRVIHSPKKGETSYKDGDRPYLTDAVKIYELGGGIVADVEDEIDKEIE